MAFNIQFNFIPLCKLNNHNMILASNLKPKKLTSMSYISTPNICQLELLELLEKVSFTKRRIFVLGNIVNRIVIKLSRPYSLKNLGPENIEMLSQILGKSSAALINEVNHYNQAFNYVLDSASLARLKEALVLQRGSTILENLEI